MDECNPAGGFPSCQAHEFARARFMASIGMDRGVLALGFYAFANWRSANPYRDYRGSMTLAEYNAMCEQQLADLIDAVRNATSP